MKNVDVFVFWNELDTEAREEIIKLISEHHDVHFNRNDIGKPYDELPELWQNLINSYHKTIIEPQKGKQQTKFDGRIEEELPSEFKCPRCGSQAIRAITKRGEHIKCPSCSYDSNQVFDFDKDRRRGYVIECMKLLKNIFPQFNYFENIPYSPDIIVTGERKEGIVRYDFKIIWTRWTLARIRVELNQHLTKKQFFDADECYIIGRRDTVDYLDSRDALICHLLVDEKESDKILMSRAKDIIRNNITKEDRFKNIQYFIPKDLRKEIVKSSKKDIIRLIAGDFYELFYKNIGVL